jgi:Predicted nucleic acid-binding protein, contains PIN domain
MILVDSNVVLDVFLGRAPFVHASQRLLTRIERGAVEACLAGHSVTTVHYLCERYVDDATARRAIDFLLQHFSIAAITRGVLVRAQGLARPDFEDAVVAAAAEAAHCAWIVTRDQSGFAPIPVPPIAPEEFLDRSEP